jgi:hypothetical protein
LAHGLESLLEITLGGGFDDVADVVHRPAQGLDRGVDPISANLTAPLTHL